MHLLEAGVELNVIRGWLGHVSLDTTNRYAEINIGMKEAALRACEPPVSVAEPGRESRKHRPKTEARPRNAEGNKIAAISSSNGTSTCSTRVWSLPGSLRCKRVPKISAILWDVSRHRPSSQLRSNSLWLGKFRLKMKLRQLCSLPRYVADAR
jgi:hypothetical protein